MSKVITKTYFFSMDSVEFTVQLAPSLEQLEARRNVFEKNRTADSQESEKHDLVQ